MICNQLWGLEFWQNDNIQCKWGKGVFLSQHLQFSLACVLQPPAASHMAWSSKTKENPVFYPSEGTWPHYVRFFQVILREMKRMN